jgi:hypothetical protein
MSRQSGETYYGRAQLDLEAELGGRFARPKPLVGEVPRQPEGSPWAHDPVGPEPPLGYSIDAMEPVGAPHEIERSLRIIEEQQQEEEVEDV